MERCDGLCAYCRRAPCGSIDHFIPLALGGQDDFTNIIPSCGRCNSTKRENEPLAWVRNRLGESRLAFIQAVMFRDDLLVNRT